MNMIYYEALKLLRSKAVLFALGFLLLLNGVCVLYSAEHVSEEGYSPAEAAGVAEEWSGMSLGEAIDYITSELETYSVNVSSGESISEADFVRGTILSSELSRLTELSQYNEYREGIQASAEAMTRTGLFGGSNSFARRTAENTAQVYKRLEVNELTPDAPYGISLVIDSRETGYILLLIEIAFALLLFLQERDSGMMALLLSKPAGRKHTAAAKIITLWAASIVVCLLFYGSNLILAWKLAGLGPLDRPIQTLTGFYSSPWELSAGTYLVIFLLHRMLAEAMAGTVFAWLCTLFKNGKLAAAVICAVFIAEMLLGAYADGWPRYFNLAALRDPNAFFCDYICLSLFGIPVNILSVSIFALILLILGGSIGTVLCYARQWAIPAPSLHRRKSAGRGTAKKNVRINASVTRQEIKKLLGYRGGLPIAAALFLAQMLIWGNTAFRATSDVFYYRAYAREFSGVISEETDRKIAEEEDRLDTSDEQEVLAQALEAGTITQDYYEYAIDQLQTDSFQFEAFARIKTQFERAEQVAAQVPAVELIDVTGWDALLGKDGAESNLICLLSMLLCEVLLFSGYGVYEKTTGVELLIIASRTGRKNVYRKKRRIVMGQSFLLALFGFFPRWIWVIMHYGLDGIHAPAASFVLQELPAFFTMTWLLVLFTVFLLVLCILAGTLIWQLSLRSNSVYSAMFLSAACFILPVIALLLFLY